MTDEVQRSFAERVGLMYERFSHVAKGGTNKHFKYRFVREADLKRVLSQALRDVGMVLSALECTYEGDGKAGVGKVTITIMDPASSHVLVLGGCGGGADSSDKAPQKAMTAAFKYALLNGMVVATGDDDDRAPSPAALLNEINAVSTNDLLAALKARVNEFSGSASFDGLKLAYQERAKALRG